MTHIRQGIQRGDLSSHSTTIDVSPDLVVHLLPPLRGCRTNCSVNHTSPAREMKLSSVTAVMGGDST
jgi:hypothetical protein